MATYRLFITLDFPEPILAQIHLIMQSLKNTLPQKGIKWVSPSILHLTLKFLGDVSIQHLPNIQAAIAKTANLSKSATAQVGGLGAYPSLKKPNNIWIGVSAEPVFKQIFTNLETNMESIGFVPDPKGFSPHITLARITRYATYAERNQIADSLQKFDDATLGSCIFDAIHLYRSDLKPSGPIYTKLYSANIQN